MIKQFFWMCSGADTDLLDESPKSEQIKYAGIGGTVFFTAVMAFISGSYALFTVFDNLYIAIAFGIVWGLLIFNLDRFIVSTIKKQDNFWKEFLQASPRIILAMIIAVVISKPLEIKIFEKEINQVLLEQKNALTLQNQNQIAQQYTPEILRVENEIEALKIEVDTKEKEVNDSYKKVWKDLYKTMSDKHIKFLESEFIKVEEARKIGEKYYPNQLFYTIAEMITLHHEMHEQGKDSSHLGPLSMLPEIAEAWMQQEFMAPSFQCPGCSFRWLPCSKGTYQSYFKLCPICGENLEK